MVALLSGPEGGGGGLWSAANGPSKSPPPLDLLTQAEQALGMQSRGHGGGGKKEEQ
jgi:hypothetical protein